MSGWGLRDENDVEHYYNATVRLMAENERLRDENERLRAEVESLTGLLAAHDPGLFARLGIQSIDRLARRVPPGAAAGDDQPPDNPVAEGGPIVLGDRPVSELRAENERLLRDMGVLRDENLRLMVDTMRLRALLDPDNEALVEQIADVAFETWDTARLNRFNEVARAVLAALGQQITDAVDTGGRPVSDRAFTTMGVFDDADDEIKRLRAENEHLRAENEHLRVDLWGCRNDHRMALGEAEALAEEVRLRKEADLGALRQQMTVDEVCESEHIDAEHPFPTG